MVLPNLYYSPYGPFPQIIIRWELPQSLAFPLPNCKFIFIYTYLSLLAPHLRVCFTTLSKLLLVGPFLSPLMLQSFPSSMLSYIINFSLSTVFFPQIMSMINSFIFKEKNGIQSSTRSFFHSQTTFFKDQSIKTLSVSLLPSHSLLNQLHFGFHLHSNSKATLAEGRADIRITQANRILRLWFLCH